MDRLTWFKLALSAICGLATLVRDAAADEPPSARFHHVLLNTVDPAKSIRFYSRVFGASPIKFRGVSDGLFTEKSFILFNKVDAPPRRHTQHRHLAHRLGRRGREE